MNINKHTIQTKCQGMDDIFNTHINTHTHIHIYIWNLCSTSRQLKMSCAYKSIQLFHWQREQLRWENSNNKEITTTITTVASTPSDNNKPVRHIVNCTQTPLLPCCIAIHPLTALGSDCGIFWFKNYDNKLWLCVTGKHKR